MGERVGSLREEVRVKGDGMWIGCIPILMGRHLDQVPCLTYAFNLNQCTNMAGFHVADARDLVGRGQLEHHVAATQSKRG